MELRQYLSVLRGRWLLILFTTLFALGVGFTISRETPEYTARSTLYVGQPPSNNVSTDQLAALDRVVLTFSKMIDSEPIASRAVEDLNLDRDPEEVVEATDVEPEPATQLLYIEVTDKVPATAQSLANALADGFVEEIPEFAESDAGGSTRLPARVYERAALPTAADPTDQLRTLILSGIFGLIAGAALAFLLDYLDVSLRNAADVERKLELPVLGVIPALGAEAPFGRRITAPDSERREGRARERVRDRDRGRELELERERR